MPFKINDKIEDRVLLHYVPHGIDSDIFKPIEDDNQQLKEFKKRLFNNKEVESIPPDNAKTAIFFILLY